MGIIGVMRITFLVTGMALLTACHQETSTKPANPLPAHGAHQEKDEKIPAAPPSSVSSPLPKIPFAEAYQEFLKAEISALPMEKEYPSDPGKYVTREFGGEAMITTAWGMALLQGDRIQVGRYLKAGADIKQPVWYKAESNLPVRSTPAHMAINAVYMKQAAADYFKFILDQGADSNGSEITFHGEEKAPKEWDQATLLFHTVTAEIPELVDELLTRSVNDMNEGTTNAKGGRMTPLFTAVLRRNTDIVRILLDHGADPRQGSGNTGGNVKSSLDFAREYLHREKDVDEKKKIEAILQLLTIATSK